MDFGKVDAADLGSIDFRLPPDHPSTAKVLSKTTHRPRIFVGCAKWGRKDWVGQLYPPKTKEADFLSHYATHFNCIELNATFYRLPTEAQTKGWKEKVGKDFLFCPKFTDQISHFKRLKGAEEVTSQFLKGIAGFGENLGPLFLQLPPNFTPKSADVLEAYLANLPKDLSVFVEVRHPGWFNDATVFGSTFDAIEKLNIGSVITDASGRRDCVHMRLTTSEAFIRFVGNGLHPTDYTRIDEWVARIDSWMKQGIKTVYFFMHQHEEIHSPTLSKYLIEQLNSVCGTIIPEIKFVQDK